MSTSVYVHTENHTIIQLTLTKNKSNSLHGNVLTEFFGGLFNTKILNYSKVAFT